MVTAPKLRVGAIRVLTGYAEPAGAGSKGGVMKRVRVRRQGVCMLCGKASKERICDPCKAKLRAEALYKKLQTENGGKRC
jgi:hypothetical protein